jgi:NAD(P)H-nitrite reductase large subunit
VPLTRILAAIRGGADSIEKIQAETCASTGCGGCEWEVQEILRDELEKKK